MSQLQWPHVLSAALRLKVADAILQSGRTLEAYGADPHAEEVLDEFEKAAAATLRAGKRTHRTPEEASEEGPAVDAYFTRVGKALIEQTQACANGSELSRELMKVIGGVCGTSTCLKCDSQTQCRWVVKSGAEDALRMAMRGGCISEVRAVFDWTSSRTGQVYSALCKGLRPFAAKLETCPGIRNHVLDLEVNALTDESEQEWLRIVRVAINPVAVWVEDYLSLGYILMHECVAHAWCGAIVDDGDSPESTSFHEGWMDVVAYKVLNGSLKPPQATTALPSAGAALAQARMVHLTRYNPKRVARSPDVADWIIGAQALETLRRLFAAAMTGNRAFDEEEWDKDSTRALEEVLTLSIRINASKLTHETRGDFVGTILRHYVRTTAEKFASALAARMQVIDFINEYLSDQDHMRFVRQVIAIHP